MEPEQIMVITPEFSRSIDVSRLPPEGRKQTLSATAEECEALRARFGVDAFKSLEVEVSLQPWKRGGCRVRGHARAEMTRTCVVTIEPFDQVLEVKLDRLFAETREVRLDGNEVIVSIDDEDFGQVVDGEIEVGEFAVEELLLELDPHPRKPGAEFKPPAGKDGGTAGPADSGNPFAVLKSLKDQD
jgi:uncharacterized metal-binding protein YceD (DUF177 family)